MDQTAFVLLGRLCERSEEEGLEVQTCLRALKAFTEGRAANQSPTPPREHFVNLNLRLSVGGVDAVSTRCKDITSSQLSIFIDYQRAELTVA